jgi:hypothetical protein
MLNFQQPSAAFAGENANMCSGSVYTNMGATATNYTQLNWTTSGTGIFSNPAVMYADYTPSAEDIAAGSVTLTLAASNQSCTAAVSSKTLTINASPNTNVEGETVVCAQTNGVIYSTQPNTGNTYEWTVAGGTIETGAGTNQITVNWNSDASGLVTVAENTQQNCMVTHTRSVSINPIPATSVSGAISGCPGDMVTYSTTANSGNSYTWDITGGTITSGQGSNEVQVTWNTTGTNSISVIETVLATECTVTENVIVTINGNAGVPSKPQGPAEVDLNATGNTDYTVTPAAFAQSYVWQLLPAEAGIVSGNTESANVVWNSVYRGTATLTAKAVNSCNESTLSEAITVNVFSSLGIGDNTSNIGVSVTPNPNNGNFKLSVSTPGNETLQLRIAAANGKVVYEQTGIESNGNYSDALNLNLSTGTYTITISTSNGYAVKKFVVTK